MSSEETGNWMPLPATLLLGRNPSFPIHDLNGVLLETASLDPSIDPVVVVATKDTAALMRWGEQHAAAILEDDAIPLRERQLFLHRGLTLQATRLFHHRARFKRLGRLVQALQSSSMFLSAQPSTYAATLGLRPPGYHPAAHAVGTSLLSAGLYSQLTPGPAQKPEALMAPLLSGLVADIGLVDSHRDLLSFEQAMTPPERNILRAHPHASSRILQHLGISTDEVLNAVEFHHERIDGSGYPVGLGGNTLPLLAQCVGLADTFMMLVSERPKTDSVEPSVALDLVRLGSFDAELVAALGALLKVSDAAQSFEVGVAA